MAYILAAGFGCWYKVALDDVRFVERVELAADQGEGHGWPVERVQHYIVLVLASCFGLGIVRDTARIMQVDTAFTVGARARRDKGPARQLSHLGTMKVSIVGVLVESLEARRDTFERLGTQVATSIVHA